MVNQIRVNYEAGAAEFARLLLRKQPTDVELAGLAGALDGATVKVSVSQKKGWLYLAVDDPARFEIYETSIRQDSNGDLYGYIHEVRVAAGQGGQGYGARAFLSQVTAAKAIGLKRFELWAAGDVFDGSRNGYYTWARFGFNAPLDVYWKKLLTPDLKDAQTVNEVINRNGKDWWKRFGGDASMVFDLHPESTMMKLFSAYLNEKGITQE